MSFVVLLLVARGWLLFFVVGVACWFHCLSMLGVSCSNRWVFVVVWRSIDGLLLLVVIVVLLFVVVC